MEENNSTYTERFFPPVLRGILMAIACFVTVEVIIMIIGNLFIIQNWDLVYDILVIAIVVDIIIFLLTFKCKYRHKLLLEAKILMPILFTIMFLTLPWSKCDWYHRQYSDRLTDVGEQKIMVNDCMLTMMPVKRGSFIMGGDGFDADGDKPHKVVLTHDFYLSETEVTQELWKAVMGEYSVDAPNVGPEMPANYISYDDAMTFISRLNTLTGKNFRLPTEAEWEYACRGGEHHCDYRYSGSDDIEDVAWFEENSSDRPHKVALLKPNILGLYDMTGNLEEWCQDMYVAFTDTEVVVDPIYNYEKSDGRERVARGGSFASPDHSIGVKFRSINQYWDAPSNSGLRLAL